MSCAQIAIVLTRTKIATAQNCFSNRPESSFIVPLRFEVWRFKYHRKAYVGEEQRKAASLSGAATPLEQESGDFYLRVLPGKREASVISVVAPAIVVIAPGALVVSSQETLAVCLLILIRISVATVTTVVAVTVAVEMRPLRVVTLTALSVIRSSVDAILITLVEGYLIVVSILAVLTITAISIVPITISAIVPVTIAVATIRVLAIRPLSLNGGAGDWTYAHQEKHREQDFADPSFEIM